MRKTALVLGLVLVSPALAQQSASYKMSDHAFNAGGHPEAGTILTSTSYRVTLDALGAGLVGTGLISASFRMDGSFGSSYPPPGEASGLRFTDSVTLVWTPEKSVGDYNLYRDLISNLPGGGYGPCEQHDLPEETTSDSDTPPVGGGYFYLVTAVNRLGEEGAKGSDSLGEPRPNLNPCP